MLLFDIYIAEQWVGQLLAVDAKQARYEAAIKWQCSERAVRVELA